MKYDIKMACGHTETKELFGKTSERESKIAWYESHCICAECQRKEREAANAAAAETAANNGWAKLEGSEKQVAWAESIRATKIAELDKVIESVLNQPERLEICNKIKAILTAKTSASYWIDNRDNRRLFAEVMKSL